MKTNEKIRMLRKQHGITQDELAEYLNTTKQTIYKYEMGIITNIPLDKIEKLAKKFNVTASYLAGWDEEPLIDSYSFPIIGEVAAGYNSIAYEETGDTVAIPDEWLRGQDPSMFFILIARGDSMKPYIEDGDLLLCHRQNSVDPNTIAIVLYESELATVKKVNYDPQERWWMDLIPLNRDYEIMHVVNEDLNRCKVLGSVWKMIREIEK